HKEKALQLLLDRCPDKLVSSLHQFISPRLCRDPFVSLPYDIRLRVLAELNDPISFANASQVSKLWYSVLNDDHVWKNLMQNSHYKTVDDTVNRQISNYVLQDQFKTSYKRLYRKNYLLERAWNHGGTQVSSILTGSEGVVTCLLLLNEGIIFSQDNSRISHYSYAGEPVRTYVGHTQGVWALAECDGILVSGGCDRNLRVWSVASGECLAVLKGHSSTIRCVRMADKNTAVSCSRDSTIRIWDLKAKSCLHRLSNHEASVRCIDLCGDYVVSGSYDSTAKIWRISTGELLHTLNGHLSQIYAIVFDGSRVITGSLDTNVRVWNANTGNCIALLQGHTSLVALLELRGDTLVTGGSDGAVRVWDLKSMTCELRLAAHDNSVTCLQFDDHRLITGGSDGRVKIWDMETGHLIRELNDNYQGIWRLEFSEQYLVILAYERIDAHLKVLSFQPDPDALEVEPL
ncbi:hypothetical protein CANCADRAFT_11423, partial [Tortispora caseinolytica NRRL Y-17796]